VDIPGFARLGPEGLSLFVRVTPNAGRDAIEAAERRDDGSVVLRLRVKAVADKGRANAAAVALVAGAMGVPKSSVRLVSGDTARLKTLLVLGDGPALAARAGALGAG